MSSIHFSEFASPGVQGLHPYQPGKPIEELQRELGLSKVIKLASNENPLGASPKGRAAAKIAMEALNIYPDDFGFRLRQKLSAQLKVTPEMVTLGSGSSDVIDMVSRSFLQPGKNAVFSAHAFAMYSIYTQASGATAKIARALPADHPDMPYGHDLDALADQVDANTAVVFIANPNNPTGGWLDKHRLKSFITALRKDIVVVLDEAYFEYVKFADFPDGIQWVNEFPNLIVTRTFSKIYGLAALRVGYGICSAELTGVINRVRHPFNVNSVALAAAEAALDDQDFLQRSVENNASGMQQLSAACDVLKLAYIPSAANFLCIDMGTEAAPLFDALLKQGAIVRPVGNYALPNHLRVTIGTEKENAIFLTALEKVLK